MTEIEAIEELFSAAIWKCWWSLEERDQEDPQEDSSMGFVVTNDPCRGQGTGKILLLEKQGQREFEKRRAAEQNHKVLKKTWNKTLHSFSVKILILLMNTWSVATCVKHKARLDKSMIPLGLQMSGYEFEIAIQISSRVNPS